MSRLRTHNRRRRRAARTQTFQGIGWITLTPGVRMRVRPLSDDLIRRIAKAMNGRRPTILYDSPDCPGFSKPMKDDPA